MFACQEVEGCESEFKLPFVGQDGGLLDGEGIAERARRIEAAGLDGVWMGDRMPLPGGVDRALPDPLMYLMICALATSAAVEVGTCIYCLPLRNKYEAAQRVLTLETAIPGRFTFGVATGSQDIEYNTNGLDWESRFVRMADHMASIRGSSRRCRPVTAGITEALHPPFPDP